MTKRADDSAPIRASHGVLCLELSVGLREGEPRYIITASVPGREGTLTSSWGRTGRLLTDAESQDLLTYVLRMLTDVVIVADGTQGVMPFG